MTAVYRIMVTESWPDERLMTVPASVERRGCADDAQGGRLVPRPRQNDSVTMILLLAWSSPDTSFAEPITPANAGGARSFQSGRPWPGIAEFGRSPAARS
jgi:hypothetical protein